MRLKLVLAAMLGLSSYAAIETGSLPASWLSSKEGNCLEEPAWLIHQYNEDFFILRESGCTNYEKPFLYLLFGRDRALLLDTGAGEHPGTAAVISQLIGERSKHNGKPAPELIVVHSHGHRDHTSGDTELAALPDTRVIPPDVTQLRQLFAMEHWPDQPGQIDLGNRLIDAIAIPGHETASIALYDRRTAILLTGDTLYPGRLYVTGWLEFRRSISRLVEFTRTRPVAHILGAHIEQTRTPFRDYPAGTAFQPAEHELQLSRGTLLELDAGVRAAGDVPQRLEFRDFTVVPRAPRTSPAAPR